MKEFVDAADRVYQIETMFRNMSVYRFLDLLTKEELDEFEKAICKLNEQMPESELLDHLAIMVDSMSIHKFED